MAAEGERGEMRIRQRVAGARWEEGIEEKGGERGRVRPPGAGCAWRRRTGGDGEREGEIDRRVRVKGVAGPWAKRTGVAGSLLSL